MAVVVDTGLVLVVGSVVGGRLASKPFILHSGVNETSSIAIERNLRPLSDRMPSMKICTCVLIQIK